MVNTTFRGCFYLNHAFLRSVPGLQYDNIVHVYTGHTNVNNDSLVNTITDSVNQSIKVHITYFFLFSHPNIHIKQ